VNKDLIVEVGRAEAIGRPILYGTTKSFLDYFGLASIKDLPEPGLFEDSENLEEETQLLFNKLDMKQPDASDTDVQSVFGFEEEEAFPEEDVAVDPDDNSSGSSS
jgi:segregation and condensation protein B